ncbi:MAG: polyprenyl synthetase family protein [Pseudomonadota bacterium]
MTFHAALSQAATATEDALERLLPKPDLVVEQAMRYATLGGGKRLRAFFVIETAAMFGIRQPQSVRVAAAVEMIHAYSLIHDDLPAMDDDDTRRGKPTVHKKWDDATAILAGDALQSLAFEVLTSAQTSPDANVRIKLVQRLAEASGVAGMVGGQALDIAAQSAASPLSLEQITTLQALKTGALIGFSLEAGAILGKSNADALIRYAADVGLAFQIQDDILDATGDAELTGKAVGKDAQAGKATFVSLLGLEGAQEKAAFLVERACSALDPYGAAASELRRAARFVITRSA